jgi:hypothetical protein
MMFLFVLSSCFSLPAAQEGGEEPEISEEYLGLRSMIISIDPQDVGFSQNADLPNVWGVLTEFQVSNTPITIISLADGTTSMYLGNGGGFIGAGEHEEIAALSKEMIALSESYLDKMEPSTDLNLPKQGEVNFHFLTFEGSYTISIKENKLVKKEHDFYPLWYKANDIITQIRLLSSDK